MRTRREAVLATCLALVGAAALCADQANNGGQNNEVRLRTSLAGAAIQGKTPEGHADFRSDDRGRIRLNVEVEHVNLPAGTVLTVTIHRGAVTTVAGTITLSAFGEGELELDSQDGKAVPAIKKGDMVRVSTGGASGPAILAGAF